MEHNNQPEEKLLTPYVQEFLERYELSKVHYEFRDRIILLSIAGLGLITALAWDQLFRGVFDELFGHLGSITENVIYALFLTLFTTLVTVLLTKILKRKAKK